MPANLVDELHLPRTLRIRAGGRTVVLAKRAGEFTAHVLLKATGYARYAPPYPGLRIEMSIGLRYKPDRIALDDDGELALWIECGHVDRVKVRKLLRRYPRTRFVWLQRQSQYEGAVRIVADALASLRRAAPVEVGGVDDATLHAVIETGDADRVTHRVTMQRIGAEVSR